MVLSAEVGTLVADIARMRMRIPSPELEQTVSVQIRLTAFKKRHSCTAGCTSDDDPNYEVSVGHVVDRCDINAGGMQRYTDLLNPADGQGRKQECPSGRGSRCPLSLLNSRPQREPNRIPSGLKALRSGGTLPSHTLFIALQESVHGPSRPVSLQDLTSAFGAKRKWAGRQSSLPRSKMTRRRRSAYGVQGRCGANFSLVARS
jgi:hypothetical protein